MQYAPYSYYRGPHRLLWFIIGAGAATWWFKHKDSAYRTNCRGTFGPGSRPLTVSPSGTSNVGPNEVAHWGPTAQRTWDEHPVGTFSRQAADTATEITEATLDQIMSVAEALKAKLAENRAQRQQLDQAYQEEEPRKEPPQRLA